jgi:hypothetical protein
LAWNDRTVVNRFGLDIPPRPSLINKYYSGHDVYVFVVRDSDKKLVPIPVTGFQFGISQEKIPIYGAWSYTYDAVSDGSRIVQGQFSLVFTEPNHMGRLLSLAGDPDHNPSDSSITEALDLVDPDGSIKSRALKKSSIWGSELNDIEKAFLSPSSTNPSYKGVQSRREAYPFGSKGSPEALYASHPPFDLLIAFGANPAYSQSQFGNDATSFDYEVWAKASRDYLKMTEDMNERNMFDPVQSERVYIEDVHLMNSGIAMDTSGQPLVETYSFMARDVSTPYINH